MTKKCRHYFISGKVQGVWYRASTVTEAKQLNITGWIKNLADGRVELIACGEEANLDKLQRWLKVGPPLAKVTDVVWQEVKLEDEYSDFLQI